MSASLSRPSPDVISQDFYREYVCDRSDSDPADECAALGGQQSEDGLDLKRNILEEVYGVGTSMVSDTEDDDLFQTNLISVYLRDVSQYQLLNPEQEMNLARTIKEGQETLVHLVDTHCAQENHFGDLRQIILVWQGEVESYPGLREKIVEHIVSTLERAAAQEGAPEICRRLLNETRGVVSEIDRAKDEMVKANLRLVLSIAKRYRGRGLGFLDLIQEGNMGLLKAVSRYDYTRGNRFSTYATWWVRQSIIRAIYEKTNTIRLPVHVIEMKTCFYKTSSELAEELGREPSPLEISEHSGLPLDKVTMLSQLSSRPASLEATVGNREQILSDFLEDEKTLSPLEGISQQELVEVTRKVLASLSPREEGVLKSRFGIDGRPEQTLKTIGGRFGVSKERIRQIEKRAIQKLRTSSRSSQLKCFVE